MHGRRALLCVALGVGLSGVATGRHASFLVTSSTVTARPSFPGLNQRQQHARVSCSTKHSSIRDVL